MQGSSMYTSVSVSFVPLFPLVILVPLMPPVTPVKNVDPVMTDVIFVTAGVFVDDAVMFTFPVKRSSVELPKSVPW